MADAYPSPLRCPPPRDFENFKLSHGSEVNCIFKENEAVLRERRDLLRQLTEEVNRVKKEIDRTAAAVQRKRAGQGTAARHGRVFWPLQDKQEAALLQQLREQRALYLRRYDVLQDTRAEVNYWQHRMDECRVRMLSGQYVLQALADNPTPRLSSVVDFYYFCAYLTFPVLFFVIY